MRNLRLRMGLSMLAAAVLISATAQAHHSAAMFDDKQEVTLTGTVKEFQFTNPHSWLLVDVKGADGKVTTWGFEAEGPSTNTITTVVTDNGVPPLSATNSFTVVVNEVNSPPTLPCFLTGTSDLRLGSATNSCLSIQVRVEVP